MNLVTLDDICLDYGEQTILKDASLSLEEGERVCIIGSKSAHVVLISCKRQYEVKEKECFLR